VPLITATFCASDRGASLELTRARNVYNKPMQPDAAPVFRLDGLRKTYGEGEAAVHALRGVDLTVGDGE
jgi:hypothetical protein